MDYIYFLLSVFSGTCLKIGSPTLIGTFVVLAIILGALLSGGDDNTSLT